MRYATKKECAGLLALLGEESLIACKRRREPEKSVGVSWVGNYIVTLENYHSGLLMRVTAPVPAQYTQEVERRMHSAAMRESGYFHLSTRTLGGFALAEVAVYGAPHIGDPAFEAFEHELEAAAAKLDAIFYAAGEACG